MSPFISPSLFISLPHCFCVLLSSHFPAPLLFSSLLSSPTHLLSSSPLLSSPLLLICYPPLLSSPLLSYSSAILLSSSLLFSSLPLLISSSPPLPHIISPHLSVDSIGLLDTSLGYPMVAKSVAGDRKGLLVEVI